MFKLDDNLLIELGLGSLPPVEKNRMLSHIYETLEMRVGMKLAQKMTNEQLDEFEAFIDRSDEAGALKWLETNFPDYKQVVANELETLKQEIRAAAPQIVAASQQQAAALHRENPMAQMQTAGAPTGPQQNVYQQPPQPQKYMPDMASQQVPVQPVQPLSSPVAPSPPMPAAQQYPAPVQAPSLSQLPVNQVFPSQPSSPQVFANQSGYAQPPASPPSQPQGQSNQNDSTWQDSQDASVLPQPPVNY